MGISCNGHNLNNFGEIYFKLGGDVPWVGVYQVCSNGHVPMNLDFFYDFFSKISTKVLIGKFNMGISCNGHNFNNIDQIYFKLGGDVPWVDLYQVCSNGHALLIFGFFMNLFVLFWGEP